MAGGLRVVRRGLAGRYQPGDADNGTGRHCPAHFAALLAANADPDLGTPSARLTAEMFDRGELLQHVP